MILVAKFIVSKISELYLAQYTNRVSPILRLAEIVIIGAPWKLKLHLKTTNFEKIWYLPADNGKANYSMAG